VNLVQELYLDEWSSMHRIDTKVEHVKGEEEFPRYSVPPPDLKDEEQSPPASYLLPVASLGSGPRFVSW
jgi:hypothetical protein